MRGLRVDRICSSAFRALSKCSLRELRPPRPGSISLFAQRNGRKKRAPLGSAPASPVPSFAARLRGCAYTTSLSRMRTGGILPPPFGPDVVFTARSARPKGVEHQQQRHTAKADNELDFPTPYAAPEHRKALGMRPEGVAHTKWATGSRDRMSRRACAGPKAAERKKSAASGGVLSLVAFFARAKKATHGSGAEHPRLKHRARRAHEIFFGYRGN